MNGARDAVLRRIRDALGPDRAVAPMVRDYHTTSHLDDDAVVDRFAEVVDDYRATVHRCAPSELAATVGRVIADAGARRVAVPAGLPQDWLTALSTTVEVVRDAPAAGTDADGAEASLTPAELDGIDVVVTGAAVAIAETGTIVLDAGAGQGRRTLTLVPDHHVCVVHAERIVGTVPEALGRLDPVRPLTMISGPSATSDIELDRVEGVHGPRALDVIVVAPPLTDRGADDA